MRAQGLQRQRIQELVVHGVVGRGDRDLAVRRLEQPVGRDDPVVVAGARGQLAAGEVVGGLEAEQADHAGHQADADRISAARAFAAQQRGQHAQRAVHARDQVADGRARAHGRIVLAAVQAHESAHRLGDEIEGGPVAIRTGGAEAVDAAMNDVRTQRFQGIVAETHLFHDAGTVVFDHDVAGGNQLAQDVLALLAVQVQRDRSLVAVVVCEVPAQTILDHALAADRIAFPGCFYLDDFGPHVGQDGGAIRARDDAGQVQDADSGEWHSLCLRRCRRLPGVSGP
ncbi:hypothetical protein D9M68_721280 [compost metagenome]